MMEFRHNFVVRCLLVSVCVLFILSAEASPPGKVHLAGPYLGQKLPGIKPEVFAPDLVSSEAYVEFKGSFSTDGQEYYFYRHALPQVAPKLYVTKVVKGEWTEPTEVQVAEAVRIFHPCVSHDNQRLYVSLRFHKDARRRSGFYVLSRTDNGWSAPEYAGAGMYLTSDAAGNLYTTESVWGNSPQHYLSKIELHNGTFQSYQRQLIQPHYGNQTHPCIAPDGSYMIFDINQENSSLFISFKNPDGTWRKAIDLAQHGIQPDTRGAYVSPDGKYLFFSHRGDIWWVDIRVIEGLRPTG